MQTQTPSRILFSCILCFTLTVLSGCGNRDTVAITAADQVKIDEFIEQAKTPPALTPMEQREADQYIERHGRDVIPRYLNDYFDRWAGAEMRRNTDAERMIEYLKYFVSQGANVIVQDSKESSQLLGVSNMWEDAPLIAAINAAKFLVSHGADVNTTLGDYGVSLFHLVIVMGNIDDIKFFISQGADVVNAEDENGRTPLHFAAIGGNLEVVQFIVSKGADINAKDSNGATPLYAAAVSGHLEIVKFLESKGAR
jgi:ankyrin repeat protein